jgi:hypothetical protein
VRSLGRRGLTVLLAAALFAGVFALVRWWDFALPSVGAARYQAVFLSNGQTYFGHLVDRIGPYVKVENAYYIQQTQTTADDQSQQPPESKLIRRGNELHQPLPYILIPRTAILFVEDLRPDSAVAQFMAKDGAK